MLHFIYTFFFCRYTTENGVRPYMSTCRKRAMHWWCLLMGISKIYWWENLLATNHSFPQLLCHNSVIFTCFTNFTWCNVVFSCFFCLSRNDFSIGCFQLCLVRSYPCIVQCVRCSLISMLNMHVDLLMGLWGTFSAKSIH